MATNNLNKTWAKSYLKALNNFKKDNVSIGELSKTIGIFEDVIRDHLATFDPMVRLTDDVNVKTFIPQLEEFIEAVPKKPKAPVTRNKETYKGVADFVYRHMTIPGGIVDSSIELTLAQLKELKKLVNAEYKEKKERCSK